MSTEIETRDVIKCLNIGIPHKRYFKNTRESVSLYLAQWDHHFDSSSACVTPITWQHWDEGKKLCFHAFDTANAYVNVDCDNVLHTAFMKEAIQSGNHLK